ncbi:MAG TPA: hypothetical protein VK543_16390 [Puia sp.]|nr:hypothetical protein [Puia sp.]
MKPRHRYLPVLKFVFLLILIDSGQKLYGLLFDPGKIILFIRVLLIGFRSFLILFAIYFVAGRLDDS